MNFKNTKDIIIRVVKNFLGVTAVGALVLLIAMMFFAESIIFSKEVLGLLIGIAILCLGIGGLTSGVLIFFCFCTKKIAKLERAVSDRDKIIATQNTQLRKAQMFTINSTTSKKQNPKNSDQSSDKDIFKEIIELSDDTFEEESVNDEYLEEEVYADSEQEPFLPQDSSEEKDV